MTPNELLIFLYPQTFLALRILQVSGNYILPVFKAKIFRVNTDTSLYLYSQPLPSSLSTSNSSVVFIQVPTTPLYLCHTTILQAPKLPSRLLNCGPNFLPDFILSLPAVYWSDYRFSLISNPKSLSWPEKTLYFSFRSLLTQPVLFCPHPKFFVCQSLPLCCPSNIPISFWYLLSSLSETLRYQHGFLYFIRSSL